MKHPIRAAAVLSALALSAAACGGGGSSAAAGGGGFTPRGDVTMVIPFSAGGGSDLAGRSMAAAIEAAEPGINVNSVNRVGGSGAVGYSYFLGENGNPQTLLATETSLLALPADGGVEFTHQDFTPIMKVADDYTLMVVPADAPYGTCSDVAEAGKRGRIVAGISGRGGVDDIVFNLTQDATGTTLDRVVFESGGELIAALLGKQIDVASLNPGEVLGQLESGHLKALCAYSEKRYQAAALAGIPTAAEQGIDVSFAQFRGVLAPGGISAEERQYWIDVMTRAVETQEYKDYIEQGSLQPNIAAGDAFVTFLEENNELLKQALAG
jgi:putative tricarboxylic transport membrane protein